MATERENVTKWREIERFGMLERMSAWGWRDWWEEKQQARA